MANLNNLIAYFTMEAGIISMFPMYSGGLGGLAGDHILTAADFDLPFVSVSLLWKEGYFKQTIDNEGWQHESPQDYNPYEFAQPLPNKIDVQINGRKVHVGAWKQIVKGNSGSTVDHILLTTDVDGNEERDRKITNHLYAGDELYNQDRYWRLAQEIVLGVGGFRMLQDIGLSPNICHLNEGHSAFLLFELLREYKNTEAVKSKTHFTMHTPEKAGNDDFEWDLVYRVIGKDYINHVKSVVPNLEQLASDPETGKCHTTRIALNFSGSTNAVSVKHTEVSKNIFKDYNIFPVTNGVHNRWVGPEMDALYRTINQNWRGNPFCLTDIADNISNHDFLEARYKQHTRMVDFVNANNCTGATLDYDIPTIGFARRAAAYKRGTLLFHDFERLVDIMKGTKLKLQFVFAEKAHPHDYLGKEIIKYTIDFLKELNRRGIPGGFVEEYNIDKAMLLTQGAHTWLSTPKRPHEASGTSGMKSAINGGTNFSVLDGWWNEVARYLGRMKGGWSIGPEPVESNLVEVSDDEDARDMYSKLENDVILTLQNPEKLAMMGKEAIKISPDFNTVRMLQHYMGKVYFKNNS